MFGIWAAAQNFEPKSPTRNSRLSTHFSSFYVIICAFSLKTVTSLFTSLSPSPGCTFLEGNAVWPKTRGFGTRFTILIQLRHHYGINENFSSIQFLYSLNQNKDAPLWGSLQVSNVKLQATCSTRRRSCLWAQGLWLNSPWYPTPTALCPWTLSLAVC